MIKATQQSERQPYDVVRQALKEVELDSSRRVELDDYVDVSPLQVPLRAAPRAPWFRGGKQLGTQLGTDIQFHIADLQSSRHVSIPAAHDHWSISR